MKQIFPYGRPVTGDDLIDRQEIIKDILFDVKGGQSVILVSPRRYGKSSVILETLSHLKKEGFLVGYVDIFEQTSLAEIAEAIVATVLENETSKAKNLIKMIRTSLTDFLKNIQFKHIREDNEILLSFGDSRISGEQLLNEALDFTQEFAARKKKKLVFAIDEFGDIMKWNGALIKKMRAKFQRHNSVTYLFSGSQESVMRDIFTKKAYAFYGFGKLITLPPLPAEDLARYLVFTFQKTGFGITERTAGAIVDKTSSHPHYTKILAQSILDLVSGTPQKEITLSVVEEGYQMTLRRLTGELENEWISLGKAPLQKRILKFLALKQGALYAKGSFPGVDKSAVYLALSDLEKKGILRKTDRGKFAFVNPFFTEYIQLLV
ncbi:MAG: ATP-binding protein [bacterium]|nr:ATP-binding protein [bacterium]